MEAFIADYGWIIAIVIVVYICFVAYVLNYMVEDDDPYEYDEDDDDFNNDKY